MGFKAQHKEGERIDLGALISSLIVMGLVAGAGAILSVAVLSYRAEAADTERTDVQKRVRTIELNQVRLGEAVRRVERSGDWSQAKLDALLQARGVPVPARPALPPSPVTTPSTE